MRAQEILKKAKHAKLREPSASAAKARSKGEMGTQLFALAEAAQANGWNAEALLRAEVQKQERLLRRSERPSSDEE
jgi:hypothetical protein